MKSYGKLGTVEFRRIIALVLIHTRAWLGLVQTWRRSQHFCYRAAWNAVAV